MPGEEMISVSRDALRADLAELELRLRSYLDAKLELKASAAAMQEIAAHTQQNREALARLEAEGSPEAQQALQAVQELQRGRLPEAMNRSILELVKQAIEDGYRQSWLLRSNKASVALVLIAFLSLLLSLIFSIHRVWI